MDFTSSDGPSSRWFSVTDITSPLMDMESERNTSRNATGKDSAMHISIHSYIQLVESLIKKSPSIYNYMGSIESTTASLYAYKHN